MRVTANHLLGNILDDVVDVEAFFLARDFGVKHDLQQQIAELVANGFFIVRVDRFAEFVRFFDRETCECLVRLLFVPRAAFGASQVFDDFQKAGKFS